LLVLDSNEVAWRVIALWDVEIPLEKCAKEKRKSTLLVNHPLDIDCLELIYICEDIMASGRISLVD
jgi:hypothetical protein